VSAEDDRGSGTQAYAISASLAEPGLVDLGNYGTLISPVTVNGKTYYHWDLSGNRTADDGGSLNGGTDRVTHEYLDTVFNGGADTTAVDNKRTATLNGVTVRLPTYQELLDIYNSPESNPPHGWEDTATPDYWAADLSSQYTNVHLYLNLAGNTAWTTMPDAQFSVV
jgi:hypothetical protein